MVWHGTDIVTGVHHVVSTFDNTSGYKGWALQTSAATWRVLLFGSSGAVYVGKQATPSIAANTLYCFGASYDGSAASAGVTLFRDGIVQADSNFQALPYNFGTDGGQALTLGAAAYDKTVKVDGLITNVMFWRRLVKPDEFAELYADPWGMLSRRPTQVQVKAPAAVAGRIMGGLVGEGGLVGPGGIIGQRGGIVA